MDCGFDFHGGPLQDSRLRGGPTCRNDVMWCGNGVKLRGNDIKGPRFDVKSCGNEVLLARNGVKCRGKDVARGVNQLFYDASSGWPL